MLGILLFPIYISWYIFHIPNGDYIANFTEIDSKKIGKGTYYSKEFTFDKNDKEILLRGSLVEFGSTKYKYNSDLSCIYVDVYESADSTYLKSYLTITQMGTVFIKFKDSYKILEVNY